jgi:tetratricopeptide (TPR) repeat protein
MLAGLRSALASPSLPPTPLDAAAASLTEAGTPRHVDLTVRLAAASYGAAIAAGPAASPAGGLPLALPLALLSSAVKGAAAASSAASTTSDAAAASRASNVLLRACRALVETAEASAVFGAVNANSFASASVGLVVGGGGAGGGSGSALAPAPTSLPASIAGNLARHRTELDRAYVLYILALLAPAFVAAAAAVPPSSSASALSSCTPAALFSDPGTLDEACSTFARLVSLRADTCKLAAAGIDAGLNSTLAAEEEGESLAAAVGAVVSLLLPPAPAPADTIGAAATALPAAARALLVLACEAGLVWAWRALPSPLLRASLLPALSALAPTSPVLLLASSVLEAAALTAPPRVPGGTAAALQTSHYAAATRLAETAEAASAELRGPVPFAAACVGTLRAAAARYAPNAAKRAEAAAAGTTAVKTMLAALGVGVAGSSVTLSDVPALPSAGRGGAAAAIAHAGATGPFLSADPIALSIGAWLPAQPLQPALLSVSDAPALAVKPDAPPVPSTSSGVLADLRGRPALATASLPPPRGTQLAIPRLQAVTPALTRLLTLHAVCQQAGGAEMEAAATWAAAAASTAAAEAGRRGGTETGGALLAASAALSTLAASARVKALVDALLMGAFGPGMLGPATVPLAPAGPAASAVIAALDLARAAMARADGGSSSLSLTLRGLLREVEGLVALHVSGDPAASVVLLRESVSLFTAARAATGAASSLPSTLLPLVPSDGGRVTEGAPPLSAFSSVLSPLLADDGALASSLASLGAAYLASPDPAHRKAGAAAGAASGPDGVPASANAALLAAAARDPGLARAWGLLGLWFALPADEARALALVNPERGPAGLLGASLPGLDHGLARSLEKAVQCLSKAAALRPDEPVATPLLVDILSARARAASSAAGGSGPGGHGLGPARTLAEAAVARSPRALWGWWRLAPLAYVAGLRLLTEAAGHRATVLTLQASATRQQQEEKGEGAGSAGVGVSDALLQGHSDSARAHGELADGELTAAAEAYAKVLGGLPMALTRDVDVNGVGMKAASVALEDDAAAAGGDQQEMPRGAGPTSSPLGPADALLLPAALSTWHGLAAVYRAQGRHVGALRASEAAVVLGARREGGDGDGAAGAPPLPSSFATLLPPLPKSFALAPPATLAALAAAHTSLSNHDHAVLLLEAALAARPHAPATWYALGCSRRSLARLHIGDSSSSVGLAHVRAGLAAAQRAVGPGETAAAAAHKLVADLASTSYDAVPLAYGPVAAAAALGDAAGATAMIDREACMRGTQLAKGIVAGVAGLVSRGLRGAADSAASAAGLRETPATILATPDPLAPGAFSAWLVDALGLRADSVSRAADCVRGAARRVESTPLLSSLGPRVLSLLGPSALPDVAGPAAQALAASPSSSSIGGGCGVTLAAEAGLLSVRAYALAVEAELAHYRAAAAEGLGAPGTTATTTSGSALTPSSLASLLCDAGRAVYLLHFAVILACGRAGGEAADGRACGKAPAADAAVAPALVPLLAYAAHLRRVAAAVHRCAAAADPASARAWNGLGCCEDRPAVAQHALIRSVELGGGGVALVNLGALCIAAGDLPAASLVLLQAQTKDPNNEAMWTAQGLIQDAKRAAAAAFSAAGDDSADPNAAAAAATAAFTLASDLSLNSASLLPVALHALRGVYAGSSGSGSSGGNGSPHTLSLVDAVAFAQLAAERDPCTPTVLAVLAAACGAAAAEATAAADLLSGGSVAAGRFAAPSPALPSHGNLPSLCLAPVRPAALAGLVAAAERGMGTVRRTPTLLAARAGWRRTARACEGALARLAYVRGGGGGGGGITTGALAEALRLLLAYSIAVANYLEAAGGEPSALGAASASVGPLASKLRAAVRATFGTAADDEAAEEAASDALLAGLSDGDASALASACILYPSSFVAQALQAQALLGGVGGGGGGGGGGALAPVARAAVSSALARARAVLAEEGARARSGAWLGGGNAGTADAGQGGEEDVWGDGGGGRHASAPVLAPPSEARLLPSPAGRAAAAEWLAELEARAAFGDARARAKAKAMHLGGPGW